MLLQPHALAVSMHCLADTRKLFRVKSRPAVVVIVAHIAVVIIVAIVQVVEGKLKSFVHSSFHTS